MFVICPCWHGKLLENNLSLGAETATKVLQSYWKDGWLKLLGRESLQLLLSPALHGTFFLSLILLSPPSLFLPVFSITVWLQIPSALLSSPFLHFTLMFASFLLCLCPSSLFLSGLCRAWMSGCAPGSVGAAVTRTAKVGICIHATCPLKSVEWNQDGETGRGFTLLKSLMAAHG